MNKSKGTHLNNSFPRKQILTLLVHLMPKQKKKKAPNQEPTHSQVMRWAVEGVNGNIESQIKYTNYWKNAWNKYSYEPGSTMIHEKDYQPMNCCLCGKEMVSIHETHNPFPVASRLTAKEALEHKLPHRCCAECNVKKVLPARAEMHGFSSGVIDIMDVWQNESLYEEHLNGRPMWVKMQYSSKNSSSKAKKSSSKGFGS